jgi:hypothetical protein
MKTPADWIAYLQKHDCLHVDPYQVLAGDDCNQCIAEAIEEAIADARADEREQIAGWIESLDWYATYHDQPSNLAAAIRARSK